LSTFNLFLLYLNVGKNKGKEMKIQSLQLNSFNSSRMAQKQASKSDSSDLNFAGKKNPILLIREEGIFQRFLRLLAPTTKELKTTKKSGTLFSQKGHKGLPPGQHGELRGGASRRAPQHWRG